MTEHEQHYHHHHHHHYATRSGTKLHSTSSLSNDGSFNNKSNLRCRREKSKTSLSSHSSTTATTATTTTATTTTTTSCRSRSRSRSSTPIVTSSYPSPSPSPSISSSLSPIAQQEDDNIFTSPIREFTTIIDDGEHYLSSSSSSSIPPSPFIHDNHHSSNHHQQRCILNEDGNYHDDNYNDDNNRGDYNNVEYNNGEKEREEIGEMSGECSLFNASPEVLFPRSDIPSPPISSSFTIQSSLSSLLSSSGKLQMNDGKYEEGKENDVQKEIIDIITRYYTPPFIISSNWLSSSINNVTNGIDNVIGEDIKEYQQQTFDYDSRISINDDLPDGITIDIEDTNKYKLYQFTTRQISSLQEQVEIEKRQNAEISKKISSLTSNFKLQKYKWYLEREKLGLQLLSNHNSFCSLKQCTIAKILQNRELKTQIQNEKNSNNQDMNLLKNKITLLEKMVTEQTELKKEKQHCLKTLEEKLLQLESEYQQLQNKHNNASQSLGKIFKTIEHVYK